MSSYTIVAIPSQDDYVWKISSEKVPHLTILSLGDTLTNEQRTIDFLAHVVSTSLTRFGLMVDHRGVLGPQEADVLFFAKDSCIKRLAEARANLLKNKDIFLAYSSSEQYPEWTPHLTLGYPTSPAKPDKRDYPGISWVNFDRIAFWTGDYEGPEFQLSDNMLPAPLAYSDMSLEEALAHFGVRGMKWGVRRATPRPESLSRGQDKYNAQQHGKRGAERIRQRVAGGMDLKTAREAEHIRNQKQAKAVVYGALAAYAAVRIAPVVKKYTMAALETAANQRMAAAGAKAAAEAFSNSRGITNYSTINLAFNGAKGLWE